MLVPFDKVYRHIVGAHQGSVLIPLLLSILIVICSLIFTDDAKVLYDSKVNHLLYADDSVLFSTSDIGIQRNADKVNEFCKFGGLCINTVLKKSRYFQNFDALQRQNFDLVLEMINLNMLGESFFPTLRSFLW